MSDGPGLCVTVELVVVFSRRAPVCHPERVERQRDDEGSTRSDLPETAEGKMNRFALIPPLRALAGAPVGMTGKEALPILISTLQATSTTERKTACVTCILNSPDFAKFDGMTGVSSGCPDGSL